MTGQCVDLPNSPEGDTFKNKVRITAYPCREAGGMVFAYMGPKEKQPYAIALADRSLTSRLLK